MPELKRGVSGVLGGLIGDPGPREARKAPEPVVLPAAAPAPQAVEVAQAEPQPQPVEAARPARQGRGGGEKLKARRGRPPGSGRAGQEPVERKKVTLRIKASLIDEYVDWSWNRRVQLGQLIEEALESYGRKERRAEGAKTTE